MSTLRVLIQLHFIPPTQCFTHLTLCPNISFPDQLLSITLLILSILEFIITDQIQFVIFLLILQFPSASLYVPLEPIHDSKYVLLHKYQMFENDHLVTRIFVHYHSVRLLITLHYLLFTIIKQQVNCYYLEIRLQLNQGLFLTYILQISI